MSSSIVRIVVLALACCTAAAATSGAATSGAATPGAQATGAAQPSGRQTAVPLALIAARSPDGRVRATLQSTGADTYGGWGYTITWRGPRVSRSITVSSIIEQPLELHVANRSERATVVGWASGTGVSAFDVVDLGAGKLVAEVPCYQPAVSPSGRFIAFVQWFAPNLPSLARKSAVYRIADLVRLRSDPGPLLIQPFAGTAVYPTVPLTIAPGSPSTDTAKIHHMVGKFRWAGDAGVAFDDLYQNRKSRVRVNIERSGRYSVVDAAR